MALSPLLDAALQAATALLAAVLIAVAVTIVAAAAAHRRSRRARALPTAPVLPPPASGGDGTAMLVSADEREIINVVGEDAIAATRALLLDEIKKAFLAAEARMDDTIHKLHRNLRTEIHSDALALFQALDECGKRPGTEIPVADQLRLHHGRIEDPSSSASKRIDDLFLKFRTAEGKIDELQESLQQLEERTAELEAESKQRQQESEAQDLLSRCLMHDLGFSGDTPVAAYIMHHCLTHLDSLPDGNAAEALERILWAIGVATEDQGNIGVMCYWLSNVSTLLVLQMRACEAPTPGCPFLLRRQKLADLVEKIYNELSGQLKQELNSLLASYIQGHGGSAHECGGSVSYFSPPDRYRWQTVLELLTRYLKCLRDNHVPPFLIQKLLSRAFAFINAKLFNSLFKRTECCNRSNAKHVDTALVYLKYWCRNEAPEYAEKSLEALQHIGQAAAFLAISDKPRKLSRFAPKDVSPEAVTSTNTITQEVTEKETNQNFIGSPGSSSVAVVDDSVARLQIEELLENVVVTNLEEIQLPPAILNHQSFAFFTIK